MTRIITLKEQAEIISLLGAKIAEILGKPYKFGTNDVFVLMGATLSTITVTPYPSDRKSGPHLWARLESDGRRDTFHLQFSLNNPNHVGLVSAALGRPEASLSASVQMHRWPESLHPELRRIFAELCKLLDELRGVTPPE